MLFLIGGNFVSFERFSIGFSLSDFSKRGFIASSTASIPLLATLRPLLLLVLSRSGGLDDKSASIELLAVELFDGFLDNGDVRD
jgi:hypothetical protein